MGYAKVLALGDNFLFGGISYPSVTLTTVAGSQPIAQFTIPTINGEIAHVYIEVDIGRITNTNGAVNYLDGACTLKLDGAGGTTTLTIPDGAFWAPASSTVSGCKLVGYNDLVGHVTPGNSYTLDVSATAKSKQNNLILQDVQGICRVIME